MIWISTLAACGGGIIFIAVFALIPCSYSGFIVNLQ